MVVNEARDHVTTLMLSMTASASVPVIGLTLALVAIAIRRARALPLATMTPVASVSPVPAVPVAPVHDREKHQDHDPEPIISQPVHGVPLPSFRSARQARRPCSTKEATAGRTLGSARERAVAFQVCL